MVRKFGFDFSSIEFIAFLVVVLSCFFIFYKTREIYELTSHKGIGYFRKGFLFFGVSSLLFLIFNVIHFFNFNVFEFRYFFRFIFFFQFIGVSYLLFSLFYKKLKYEWLIYLFSFIIILSSFFIKSKFILGFIIFGIFLIVGIVSMYNYFLKNKINKISSQIYFIYSILVGLWIINFLINFLDFNYLFGRESHSILFACTFMYIGFIVNKKLTLKLEVK